MNSNTEKQTTKEKTEKEVNKDNIALLYQYGGLPQLDWDYYQGECPE